ncbi:hypothetical protein D0Z07_6586 [Hyphodiscus hymeniophilus]|uniref:DUF7582 domain-containing protein n=1 Tax=Hyphodiscus hymeniophilus TaxID=353542 RepID=A0A9P6VGM1_9HELO|nr:hypothetical protein D0Z07_6586 [Hyphodiscus hymeniophilus]
MGISKERISSPLEAGLSLHDMAQLPPQLTAALEYISERLARKRLHLSLIVVRKDVQIPSNASPTLLAQSSSPSHSITTSPARSLFSTTSDTIKSTLSRSSSDASISESASSSSSFSRTKWPGLPSHPKDPAAAPSPTSSTCSSPVSQCGTPRATTPNPYGISLMHATTLTPKAEKILRHTVAKAEKKFSIGSGWLSSHPLTNVITCTATNDLIRRSIAQNSILFSSEGLTLLALDHVYTFKCHLHTYSRTLSRNDLTAAVDELRRLVLAQCGRRISKGYLMRAYDWLGVSLAALVDVNEGYKVAYGGEKRTGGIEVQDEERKSPPPLKTNFKMEEIKKMRLAVSTYPQDADVSPSRQIKEVEVGESAKGPDSGLSVKSSVVQEDRGPHMRGPLTPNGFEDITPVTKGEWCFLMVGEGWKEARTAAVETC